MKPAIISMLMCLLFASMAGRAVADTALKDYRGPDGGWIVLSETNPDAPRHTEIFFRIRLVGGKGQFISLNRGIFVGPVPSDLSNTVFDPLTNAQTTAAVASDGLQLWDMPNSTTVFVFREPPGEYEIYEVNASLAGTTTYGNSLEKGRVIHVTVTAGKTAYVGAFTTTPLRRPQTWRGGYVPAWLVALNDQRERDLPIARRKAPDLSPDTTPRAPSDDFVMRNFR